MTLEGYEQIPELTATHIGSGSWEWVNTKSQRAFPGAEGYGAETTHARNAAGAQVLFVTNLNDSGAGSLRAALLTPSPRVVIFKVSGRIDLNSKIEIGNENDSTTYANYAIFGQTAPSPGLLISGPLSTGPTLTPRSNDGVVQHIRIRRHIDPAYKTRPMLVQNACSRVMVDHVSVSWSNDDPTGVWTDPTDVTWSNSISNGSWFGMILGRGARRAAAIRCLYAHDYNRVPLVSQSFSGNDAQAIAVNNLLYNCGFPGGDSPAVIGGGGSGGVILYSFLANVAKDGPSNDGKTGLFFANNTPNGSKVYVGSPDDNALTRVPYINDASGGAVELVSSPPFPLPVPLTILQSSSVQSHIAADVGARPLDRDAVDIRIINEMLTGTGRHIKMRSFGNEDETAVGGFPTLAENFYEHENDPDWLALGLDDPANRFKKDIHPFYARIELYVAKWTEQVQNVSLISDV
jgi:hypothetical protein